MANMYFLPESGLAAWLAEQGKTHAVYAPQAEGQAVVYRPYAEGCAVEFARRPTESAKHIVFPRAEELFRFSKKPDPEAGGRDVTAVTPAAEPGPVLVFGALSCDARGFFAFDPVYNGSGTAGLAKDPYYLKRREQTLLVVRGCKDLLSTCFCHWVGGSPVGTEGADALATDVEGGMVLELLTDRAQILAAGLAEASSAQVAAAQKVKEDAEKAATGAPDLSQAPASLRALFDNADFWRDQSAGCLSCGACTYLCPTCYCFNITDESTGLDGVRLRSWDTCMSALFTLEASGHNPRNGKAARLRNRVGHKYSYYPDLHESRFSCSGCGRCIKSCPSRIDIRRIVQNAVEAAKNVKEKSNG